MESGNGFIRLTFFFGYYRRIQFGRCPSHAPMEKPDEDDCTRRENIQYGSDKPAATIFADLGRHFDRIHSTLFLLRR